MRELSFVSYKFTNWRLYNVKRFLPNIPKNVKSYNGLLNFARNKQSLNLLIWGKSEDFEIKELPENVKIYRVEDGFIRSVGLGIRLTPPISLVVDPVGIYFDATKPSYLEELLLKYEFSQEQLERAEKVIEKIKTYKITKYNLKEIEWIPPKTNKKIIIIPGQVETDASIKWGSPVIKTNIELIKTVRKFNPDAYIVYKPHPDVAQGYRKGEVSLEEAKKYCDEVVFSCSSISLIEGANEIHTISSLFGFEALIRNKKVVCYGHPFYSGYGLTVDIYPNERRKRKRTLEELIVATLFIYPLYSSLISGKIISIEDAIDEILFLREKSLLRLKIHSIIQRIIDPILKMRKF